MDISNNSKLTLLECYRNQIGKESMDAIINNLPLNETDEPYSFSVYENSLSEGNVCTKEQVEKAKQKGWNVYYGDRDEYGSRDEYEGIDEAKNIEINENNFPDLNFRNWLLDKDFAIDGMITEYEIKLIDEIYIREKNISSLKGIEYFTSLTFLDCRENQLTSLDVSKNVELTKLYCANNQIKGKEMNALIESLPEHETGSEDYFFYVCNLYEAGNICTEKQVDAAKEKGWNVCYDNGDNYEGAPTITVSIDENGIATYCPENGVDFSGAQDISAYKASVNGNIVMLTKVNEVARGE